MSGLLARCAYIVEELVTMYDDARDAGHPSISTSVGAKFERRVRGVLAELEAARVESEIPSAPDMPLKQAKPA